MTSPSSLGREVACLASTVLPHSRSTGPRAVRGSDLHKFMCAMAQATTDEARALALLEVPAEWRAAAAEIDFTRLPVLSPETGVPELALAWNPTTGEVRELGRNGDVEHDDVQGLLKKDENGETIEMGGILDWCSLVDDAVLVLDFKFGWAALERAEANNQAFAYSVMATKLFKSSKAVVCLARIFDNGSVFCDVADLDGFKLDAAEARIRQHLTRVDEARSVFAEKGVIPEPVEGGHCTYCQAYRFCPAKVALLLSTIEGEPGKAAEIARLPQPLNHDIVSRMWPKLKAAEALIKKLKGDCRSYAKLYGAVKLPSGNVLGEMESESSSVDPIFARPVLEARFGRQWTDYTIKAVEKLTWKSLDQLLKKHSSHGRKAKLEREVLAELEAAGAVRSITVRRTTEVSAKAAAKKLVQREDEQEQLDEGEDPEEA